MSVLPQYLATLNRLRSTNRPAPLPLLHAVAIAIADTLPEVAGVAVCLYEEDQVRVAVGVSDTDAWSAEQWEYTVGAGPGLHTQSTGRPTSAGDDFAQKWPAFHSVLLSHTPFRAVDAVPLAGAAGTWSASMLLYYRTIAEARAAAATDITELTATVGMTVTASTSELLTELEPRPALDYGSLIGNRMAVNVAVGMLMGEKRLSPRDALDVLRAHAYTHDQTVDHIGWLLASRQLDPDSL